MPAEQPDRVVRCDRRRSDSRHLDFTAPSSDADLHAKCGRHAWPVDDTLPFTTSYTSCVVPVAPSLAAQLFTAARFDRQYRSAVASRWTVAVGPRVTLVVDGERAVLRCGRRRWKVELELAQWSSTETELGMRFLRRVAISDRARAAAASVLDELSSELQLRALIALHPQHVTGEGSVFVALP
jgi:hypothetical protein